MHCALARTCAVHEIYPLNILTNTNKRYYPRHWRGLEFCVVVREGGGGGGSRKQFAFLGENNNP